MNKHTQRQAGRHTHAHTHTDLPSLCFNKNLTVLTDLSKVTKARKHTRRENVYVDQHCPLVNKVN